MCGIWKTGIIINIARVEMEKRFQGVQVVLRMCCRAVVGWGVMCRRFPMD